MLKCELINILFLKGFLCVSPSLDPAQLDIFQINFRSVKLMKEYKLNTSVF